MLGHIEQLCADAELARWDARRARCGFDDGMAWPGGDEKAQLAWARCKGALRLSFLS